MQRKSFIFYKDWFDIIEQLPKKSQLAIYRAIPRYVFTGERPTDPLASVAFMFIEKKILSQQEKFNETCEKRKAAANKRWNDAKNANACKCINEDAKDAENEIKENEIKENDNDVVEESTTITTDTLEKEMQELTRNIPWIETVCMRFHMMPDRVYDYISDFFLDCRARGKLSHNNLQDAQAHFADWLRINLKQQQNNAINNNTTTPKEQRAASYAERISQLLAEDRAEAMENH